MRVVSQLLLTFLLNACWQIALLAAAAALGARLLRKNSMRFQHLLWVSALVLALGLPLVTTAFVSRNVWPANIWRGESPELLPVPVDLSPVAQANSFTPANSSSALSVNAKLAAAILALYLVFLGHRGVRLFRAWQRTRRIKSSARKVELSAELQKILEECQTAFQNTPISLLCSDTVPVPVTVGVRQPLVILPEQLLREPDTELLASAIGHEIVHVLRRDYLLNLIHEFLYWPLSFHPAAALVRRRINQTRELCCDELVADRLVKADVYARSLVRLAGSAPQLRNLAPTTTVGIADADILEVRIMSLLNRSETSGRRQWLLIAVAFILAMPCVAAAAFTLRLDVDPAAGVSQQPENAQKARNEEKERAVSEEYKKGYQLGQEEKERRERAERDPEFRAKLEERAREEREIKERMEREVVELKQRVQQETNVELRAKLENELQRKQEERERSSAERGYSVYKQSRGTNLAAAKWAKVSMEQAIQIATSQQPGAVLQCSLIGEREDNVYYRVVIVSGTEENPVTTHVLVNAINGTILKTWRPQAAINGGRLSSKAVNLPHPEYPELARKAGVSGPVAVEVTVDEAGSVISARAISGHPLLQAAAVSAARGAQFLPTKLNGEPVKVTGLLTYEFVAN